MATESFTYSYGYLGTVPGTGSLGVPQTVNVTLTEIDTDGTDGQTSAGDDIQYTTSTVDLTVTYVGLTAGGDPIIQSSGGSFFVLSNDPALGPSATSTEGDYLYCFAAGTLIATSGGETVVEALKIGDLVTTQDGRAVPVKWIGRQTVVRFFSGQRARPVRIAAGALGDGLPHSELVLTADHALILDGLAINAGALVNGTTIVLDPLERVPDRVTYYHVETEDHDVILANGAPAETFVDYNQRGGFDNHAEYVALYGQELTIREMPLPRVSAARLVPPSIRARLASSGAA